MYKATSNMKHIPEFVLDDMTGLIPTDNNGVTSGLHGFPDVPAVLVDDNDSVCYPGSPDQKRMRMKL